MAFEALKERVESQRREMHNRRYLETMVVDAQAVIRSNAPNLSGRMLRNLTTKTPVVETQDGFHAGLGDRDLFGSEDDEAPRGMLKQFLEDHPEFKFGRQKTRIGGRVLGTGEKVKQEFEFDKRKAWAYLPEAGKAALQQAREEGQYGGVAGMTPYFFQQEGSLDKWARGAYPANIRPTHFLQHALNEWRGEYRGLVISELNRKLGFE